MSARAAAALALLSAAALLAASDSLTTTSIFGFARSTIDAERRIESRFLSIPDPDRLRDFHRFLTREPHRAGSARNRALAEWQRDMWRAWGLEDVQILTHSVLLPYPQEVVVEMTAPTRVRASLTEDPIPEDPDTYQDPGLTYHAFSASGEVTAPVVYAGAGNPESYDWLASQGIDVRGKIALVRYSVPYSYRGFKALTAQQRGLAGLLIYSDPADDGEGRGKTYPDGPWGPESHIQRGGIPFDFLVPGDPSTPGWASTPGARRIDPSDAVSIPTIMSVPLSARDARPILDALTGPETPASWRGGLPVSYRAGPGTAAVRMRVRNDDRPREIQTVTGRIRGGELPDEEVIVGNHRDAWVFGGVDPSSGSAALMELARSFGALLQHGIRPKRTVVFASWDAEEFTLTSSTEWGEQFADQLAARAIAYLNVDSAASGGRFSAASVPSLTRLVLEAARDVRQPDGAGSILSAARHGAAAERGVLPSGNTDGIVSNRLGSGSDYTVFLNHLGIPIVDTTFSGPYGVYHSIYDTHRWMTRFGDPRFTRHRALTQVWGLMALRLANADVLPIDPAAYGRRLEEFVRELPARSVPATAAASRFAAGRLELEAAVARFNRAARRVNAAVERVPSDPGARARLNVALRGLERAFIDPSGLPGRPWYRHQIYAPAYTYAPEVLPGPAEAAQRSDWSGFDEQCRRAAAAIRRGAALLEHLDKYSR